MTAVVFGTPLLTVSVPFILNVFLQIIIPTTTTTMTRIIPNTNTTGMKIVVTLELQDEDEALLSICCLEQLQVDWGVTDTALVTVMVDTCTVVVSVITDVDVCCRTDLTTHDVGVTVLVMNFIMETSSGA